MREWQLIANNEWVFGEKIRGIVRFREGEVWHEESDSVCRWKWIVRGPKNNIVKRGRGPNLTAAIEAVEEELEVK